MGAAALVQHAAAVGIAPPVMMPLAPAVLAEQPAAAQAPQVAPQAPAMEHSVAVAVGADRRTRPPDLGLFSTLQQHL